MKNLRQEKILEIIARFEIETQEDLIEKLRLEGFDVTQATASRDIKELKLTKAQTRDGKYRYVKHTANHSPITAKYSAALSDSIVRIDIGGNIVVVKTHPGMAGAVATAIDSVEHSEILGSVAGDDTILLVTKDSERATEISRQLQAMIQSI